MTVTESGTRTLSPSRLRRGLFTLMALLTLWALYVYDLPLLTDPAHGLPRMLGFQWWLLPHALAGTVAFLIGPFQFSATIRGRNLKLHRRLGQTYVGAVTIAAALAVVIALRFEEVGGFQLVAQALVWLACTLCAWFAARNRNINVHKLWMARSYGLTFVFVTNRIALGAFFPTAAPGLVNDVSWAVVLLALIIPDMLMSGEALRPWKKTS